MACARLSESDRKTLFVCRFGNDAHAAMLKEKISEHGVDISRAISSTEHPSGQGYVLLEADGSASSVVVGGANAAWCEAEVHSLQDLVNRAGSDALTRAPLRTHPCVIGHLRAQLLRGAMTVLCGTSSAVMLQREVPEFVNDLIAKFAQAQPSPCPATPTAHPRSQKRLLHHPPFHSLAQRRPGLRQPSASRA